MTLASEERAAILAKLNDVEADIETSVEELSLIEQNTGEHMIVNHSDTIATGAQLNELVSGGGTVLHNHSGGFTSRCSVYLDGDQPALQGATTKTAFNAKVYDIDSEFDEVTNYRFQPIANGYYHIAVTVRINDLNDGKEVYFILKKTGDVIRRAVNVQGKTGMFSVSAACDVYLTTEDYIEVFVYHTEAGDLTIEGDSTYTWMDIHRFA